MLNGYSLDVDSQEAVYVPLIHGDLEYASSQQGGSCLLLSAEFWGYVFQILFQVHKRCTCFDGHDNSFLGVY